MLEFCDKKLYLYCIIYRLNYCILESKCVFKFSYMHTANTVELVKAMIMNLNQLNNYKR